LPAPKQNEKTCSVEDEFLAFKELFVVKKKVKTNKKKSQRKGSNDGEDANEKGIRKLCMTILI
jgi:hypothetical protein